jgi:hypothetical protein
MPKRKQPKKTPLKKKVKKQPKPKRRSRPGVVPAPGVQSEGVPSVPQPASTPSNLPGGVGHWNPEPEEDSQLG